MTVSMCERVADLCRAAIRDLPESADLLGDICNRLDEPLRVAIAGRVSTGKSTLVNTLLGVPVCQTGDVETTQVVTWFSFGEVERVEIVLRDGGHRAAGSATMVSFRSAMRLGRKKSPTLRSDSRSPVFFKSPTLIDTPGTESALTDASSYTEQALFVRDSLAAVADTDSVDLCPQGDGERCLGHRGFRRTHGWSQVDAD